MNTLSRFRINNSQQVKILQSLLNIYGIRCGVDGKFGKETQNAVKQFQKMAGIAVDGSVGRQTWKALRVIEDNNLFILQIPFDKIDKVGINLVNGNRNYKLANHYKDTLRNVIINAGMFTMDSAWRNCQDLIVDGKVDNGGNYSNKGIAFRKTSAYKPLCYQSTTAASRGTIADFIGGSPTLMYNGFSNIDAKGIPYSIISNAMKRSAVGTDSSSLYIISSLKNVTCKQMCMVGEKLKLTTLLNLDGGGSQGLMLGGNTVIPTDGRGIVSTIALNMRW